MYRWDIINKFIDKYNYSSYLEIGLQDGNCRDKINLPNSKKITVDPSTHSNNPTYLMTSDQFFDLNKEKFDIIFIDGLHEAAQVYKDITNSLKILNTNGTIVCHDMIPENENTSKVPRITEIWMGDCWKAWFKFLSTREDLEMFLIDTDAGIGVIRSGFQKINKNLDKSFEDMDWNFFLENIKNINKLSINEFNNYLK